MLTSLVNILRDPASHGPLQLEALEMDATGEVTEGVLQGEDGRQYRVIDGIPRFVGGEDGEKAQISSSFGFKWDQTYSYESTNFRRVLHEWLSHRYGFGSPENMRRFFSETRCVLDAGCGGGLATSAWLPEAEARAEQTEWVGVDVSRAIDVARKRLGRGPSRHFVQADILRLPFDDDVFDAVFAEGVLHHTASTKLALQAVVRVLKQHGEILFYVYRRKGPVREFTDDHIRRALSGLAPAQAWEQLKPLTKLGKALAQLRVEVDVPEDIPYLGIKAGRHDVQRLIYWHFAKLFWNEQFDFEENHHINFDWYHPCFAHRHSEEEIREWCDDLRLSIIHFDREESGFTVRAVKE